ncbi:MAG: universal stress protein [Syntrophomonadaceae bacterium]|nr:universal stress protein [Syntrophomonadaceae bacterium]
MLKKIMVAYDEHLGAVKALDLAIEIAKSVGGEIYIVSAYMTIDNPSRHAFLETLQAEAAERVLREGITVYTKLQAGGKVLGETLVRNAEDLLVDLVVIGTHNRGAIGKIMFGSVSDYVVRNVKCPVLIVK